MSALVSANRCPACRRCDDRSKAHVEWPRKLSTEFFSRLDRLPPLQGLGYRLAPVPEFEGKLAFSELGWYREPFRPLLGEMVLFICVDLHSQTQAMNGTSTHARFGFSEPVSGLPEVR